MNAARPALEVVRGNPTAEELAAVVAVVSARAVAAAAAAERAMERGPHSVWADPARNIPRVPHPGPSAWQSTCWPG